MRQVAKAVPLADGDSSGGATSPALETSYETIDSLAELERWIGLLTNATLFAFDTETTSLNYMQAEIVGVSFAIRPGQAAYVPLAHSYDDAPPQLDRDMVLAKLKPLLESDKCSIVGQHLKYDANVLRNYGIELNNIGA